VLADAERVREREGGKLPFHREQTSFQDPQGVFHIIEVLGGGPSDLACHKGPLQTVLCKQVLGVLQLSAILQRASLLYFCVRVPKWDTNLEW
jgi:hypothetical protein